MNGAPDRGDLVWLDFSPQSGHEQAGRRPALIVSSFEFNSRTSLALACPITSKVRGRGLEVKLSESSPVEGAILVAHLKSVDWKARRIEHIGKVETHLLEEVIARLDLILHD